METGSSLNDEEAEDEARDGQNFAFTGSDFVVLLMCIFIVAAVAYSAFLYVHPRRAKRWLSNYRIMINYRLVI